MRERLKLCEQCRDKFPAHLVSAFVATGRPTRDLCGICALQETNIVHGTSRKKFTGEWAEMMRQEAIEYLTKRDAKVKP